MMRPVQDSGPYTAPLLIVGEAGGKHEGAKGRPFVGAVGHRVREMVAAAGLDHERDVRYANVIPFEMATLPTNPHAMQAIVRAHWTAIEATLIRGSHDAVLVYGRAALWRLLGKTKVTDEHGSVYHIEVGGRMVPCVVSIHPAAVMRSKIEAGWTLVRAATERACRYASGLAFDAARQLPAWKWCYSPTEIDVLHADAITRTAPVALDTEYSRETHIPFIIGITMDGERVLTCVPNQDTIPAIRRLLDDASVVKLLHHAPADVASLATLGLTVRAPLVDTLMMYATVYPDLPVGLARASLHMFDHWHEWKGMAHDDPAYNAIDVVATWRLYRELHERMTSANLWPVWLREARHVGVLCMAMEARGLQVDPVAQRAAVESNAAAMATLKGEVSGHVDAIFAKRRAPFEVELATTLHDLKVRQSTRLTFDCLEHPSYNGLVKPRGKSRGHCACQTIYNARGPARTEIAALRKTRDRCVTVIERWSRGFDLGNNDHLRWLLYDADGFKLPMQRKDGRPTANADAIAKLLALKKVQESPAIRTVLVGVKEYQHLRKMVNTFLLWDEGDDDGGHPSQAIDTQGAAHPEVRAFGTGTGRVAGGPDSDLGDRKTNMFSYSVMNVPEETRAIYVPHHAQFAINAAAVTTEVVDDDEMAGGDE